MDISSRLYAVRGATCCMNTVESIQELVPQLYQEILSRNSILESDIVSVIFSMTADLTLLNPATALRKKGYAQTVPLFACSEPYIFGGLPFVIRVMITYYGKTQPIPVYIHGAEVLRPDFQGIVTKS